MLIFKFEWEEVKMKKLKCDTCRSYYVGGFADSDYCFCEKCGRLLTGVDRECKIVKESRLPRVLFIGDDAESMWSLRRALYDPRDCATTFESGEIKLGLGGVSRICSENGDVAVSMIVFREQLKSKGIYRLVADENPSITVLVLDCMKIDDISDYIFYLKNQVQLMRFIRPRYDNPLIVVLSNADNVPPADIKEIDQYPESKHKNIQSIVDRYRAAFCEADVKITDIYPISSYVRWGVIDANKCSSGIKADDLEIVVDGRYNIARLRFQIDESIHETE